MSVSAHKKCYVDNKKHNNVNNPLPWKSETYILSPRVSFAKNTSEPSVNFQV